MTTLSGGYYSDADLRAAGFRSIGRHVQIHDRANIFGAEHISLGDYVRIDQFVNLIATAPVDIQSYVHISPFCHISASSSVTIGSFSAIGAGAKLVTSSGDFEGERLGLPFASIPKAFRREAAFGPIVFEAHNLVGMNSIVMPGVTFAEGSAVGVQSTVMNDLLPWSLYLGTPARKVKDRSRGVVELARRVMEAGE
jgi:galactoside O-acetyltransferase